MTEFKKIKNVILVRFIILILIFVVAIISYGQIPSEGSLAYIPFFVLIIFSITNFLFYLFHKLFQIKSISFLSFQFLVDIIFISFLCYVSGGIFSKFSFLYYVAILSATLLVSSRLGLIYASTSTIILSGVSVLYNLAGVKKQIISNLPLVNKYFLSFSTSDINSSLVYLFFFALSLYVTSILGSILNAELHKIIIEKEYILDISPIGIIAFDINGKLAFINKSAREIIGLTDEDIGKYFVNINTLDKSKIPRDIINFVNSTLREQKTETMTTVINGRDIELSNTLIKDRSNRVKGILYTLLDTTHLHELDKARKELEKLEIIKKTATNVVHEIRNPLATIKAGVQDLSNKLSSEDAKELIRIVTEEINRLINITDDLLKPRTSKLIFAPSCDLNKLLKDTLRLLSKVAKDKNVKINENIQDELVIGLDEELVKKIIMNLASNAISFSKEDSVIDISAYKTWRNTEAGEKKLGVSIEIANSRSIDNTLNEINIMNVFLCQQDARISETGHGYGLKIVEDAIRECKGSWEYFISKEKVTFRVWLPVFSSNNVV